MKSETTKRCTKCLEEKGLSLFGNCSRSKSGKTARCKSCRNKINRANAQKRSLRTLLPTIKKCEKCREVKAANDFYRRVGSKDGLRNECASCTLKGQKEIEANWTKEKADRKRKERNAYSAKSYRKNKESVLKKYKEHRKNNPEFYKEKDKKFRARNKANLKNWSQKSSAKNRDTISDSYVVALINDDLSGANRLKAQDIPQYMIELRRQQIINSRKLKQLRNDKQ